MMSDTDLRQLRLTGSTDFDLLFLDMMAPPPGRHRHGHHRTPRRRAAGGQQLAQTIVDPQQAEFDRFQQWQQQWATAPIR